MPPLRVGLEREPHSVVSWGSKMVSAFIRKKVMNDDRRPPTQDWLEKRMGHEAYGEKRNWGAIAIGLVLIVVACGLILYLIVGG